MTTPAVAEASLGSLAASRSDLAAGVTTRPDVLFVLNSLGIGGSERKIARLTNRLREEGMHVVLACMNGPFTLEADVRRDVQVHKLERNGRFSFKALQRLRRILVDQQPATVLAVNLYQALYVALAALFLPYCPRTVALVNTSTFRGHYLWKLLYKWVLRRFDLTAHGSQAQRRFWLDAGVNESNTAWRRSTVIYNGVDSDHFEPIDALEAGKRLRAVFGVKSESLLFGTVGMCRPEKNQQVLLTTLRQMLAARIDAHLAICGDGPLRAMLERRATELGIAERVHFTGALEDVRPVLSALDIFVLPSIAVESFSNAALEAMAMGRPVILSDIGGAREMVSDGVEGYVVSATEVPARLPAIMAALCADRRKRQLMGAAARSRAINCFSVTAMVAGYRGLFHDGEAQ